MKYRIKKLQELLKANNLDALLVNELSQVRYLCGYSGSNGLLVVFPTAAIFLTDFRYQSQVAKEVVGAKVIIAQRDLYTELQSIKKLAARNLRLGYLETFLPVKLLKFVKKQFPEALLAPTNGLIESITVIKDASEIANLEKAVEIADIAFERILQIIRPGIGENEIRAELEYQMIMLGSEGPSFETIIASGYRSALPHGVASLKKVKKGEFVTLDFGALYHGYHSDMTRTVVVGKANARQKKIYNLVLKAQVAGCKKARAGLKCSEVDKHVRDIIAKAGYGKAFGHGLGHGIGLIIHDNPRLSLLSPDVLAPNMVVTIEPGIYLEGWGGVRIEDDVVITRNGCRILNKADKSLLEL
jgi:Xaa-Pro aminopeptidase